MTAKLLLTGAEGQLGSTIRQHWASSSLADTYQLECCDLADLDITDEAATRKYLERINPALVINAAAYTAVDRAEQDSELAHAVNAKAAGYIANWCAERNAKMVQISTDFVFSGEASVPYNTEDLPAPLSEYGASKRAGEEQVQQNLPNSGVIVRTSWLYSEFGNNFVKTMLRLMTEKTELGIVADQIGSPTSTHSLVKVIFQLLETDGVGIFHWSDGAAISWYDFATEIQAIGLELGILNKAIPLNKLTTAEYPTPATRPAYSVMDISNTLSLLSKTPRTWQEELRDVIAALVNDYKDESRKIRI